MDLRYNILTGVLPVSMIGLTSLKGLGLSSNQLNGVIPSSLCSLSLTFLALNSSGLSCYSSCFSSVKTLYARGIGACTASPTGDIFL